MSFLREKKLLFFKDFVNLCDKNQIWYMVDSYTLLGASKHQKFLNTIEKFQVAMTIESYYKLKELFSKNVVDSSLDKKYHWNRPVFIKDKDDWESYQFFIEIRIIVPTTYKKWKNYIFKSNWFNSYKNNLYNLYWSLYDKDYEFYYLIDNSESKCNWIKSLSFAIKKIPFYDFFVCVPIENEIILDNWFNKQWKNKLIKKNFFDYPSPNFKTKEII